MRENTILYNYKHHIIFIGVSRIQFYLWWAGVIEHALVTMYMYVVCER